MKKVLNAILYTVLFSTVIQAQTRQAQDTANVEKSLVVRCKKYAVIKVWQSLRLAASTASSPTKF